jgi:hypothetical protein
LLCVKSEKGGKVIAIRGEWAILKLAVRKGGSNNEKPKPDKEKKKGKDSVGQAVTSVEPKGENEFVVLTVRRTALLRTNYDLLPICQTTKSLSFVTVDTALRSRWVSHIQRIIDSAAANNTC